MSQNKGQLVCQHLENISRTALEKYQTLLKEFVKGRHGVYALYRKGHLYYVGLASNLRNRLKTHLKDRHAQTWDSFSVYLTINDAHLRELETLILKISFPKGNKQTGKFAKSQDLKRRFWNIIKEAQRKEREALFGIKEEKIEQLVKTEKAKGRKPVLAPYVTKRFQIRYKYKGKVFKATVRKDGRISLEGKIYTSPSVAGYGIARHSVDGWYVWKYERSPGEWVLLDTLRKR